MRLQHQNAGDTATHVVAVPRTTSAEADPYPEDGSVKAVVEWVNRAATDRLRSQRAKAAITAEHDRDHPRKTLLQELDPERTD